MHGYQRGLVHAPGHVEAGAAHHALELAHAQRQQLLNAATTTTTTTTTDY